MKKRNVLAILFGLALLAVGITACQSETKEVEKGSYQKITAEQAKKRMDSGDECVQM